MHWWVLSDDRWLKKKKKDQEAKNAAKKKKKPKLKRKEQPPLNSPKNRWEISVMVLSLLLYLSSVDNFLFHFILYLIATQRHYLQYEYVHCTARHWFHYTYMYFTHNTTMFIILYTKWYLYYLQKC